MTSRQTVRTRWLVASLSLIAGVVLPAQPASASARQQDPALAAVSVTGPTQLRPGERMQGNVILAKPVAEDTTVVVQWRDSVGRIGDRVEITLEPGQDRLSYTMTLVNPIVRRARVEVVVAGHTQLQHVPFDIVLPYEPWDDFITFAWAHYPYGGYYDTLLDYGINGEQVGAAADADYVHDHNFHFYVDQMCYQVYAYYHKRRGVWRSQVDGYAKDPRDVYLRHRRFSLSDPRTFEKVRQDYERSVTKQSPNRPVFYNLADEIGFGDQSAANDFCWDYPSRDLFRDTLIDIYGSLAALNAEWDTDYASWAAVRGVQPTTYWQYDRMYRDIYLPRQFGSADSAQVEAAFGSRFGSFDQIVALYAALRTSLPVDTAYVTKQLGKDQEKINATYGCSFADAAAIVAFYEVFDQWSFSLSVDRDDVEAMRDWNLAPWADFREAMDRQMASAIARGVAIGREYDPEGRFGFTGTHHPGVFSGHNYAKLCPLSGVIVPYNIGNTPEIIRSLNPDTCYQVLPSWKSGDVGVRDIWTRALHGDRGMIFWDNNEPKNKFLSQPDKQPTARATSLGPTLVRLGTGLGKQLIASRRDNSGIAIHYSHPSVRVDYWRTLLGTGRRWVTMRSSQVYRQNLRNVLRACWYRLIEDLNLQYDAVSSEQVADGRLTRDGYKVLIMPEVFALSQAEADQVRRFHQAGGTVIADRFCGIMDEHGKWRQTPLLADLWDQPRAHLLNRSLNEYTTLRLTPGKEVPLRDAVGKLIAETGVEPLVRVLDSRTSKPLPAAEVHAFHAGPGVCLVGVTRSIQLNQEGTGGTRARPDNSVFEQTEPVKLVFSRPMHVYDQQQQRYLGQTSSHELQLDPWVAPIFVLTDEPLTPVTATVTQDGRGATIALVDQRTDLARAVRIEVRAPSGALLRHYSGNTVLRDGKASWTVPFALNDPDGTYTVDCRDVLTGQTIQLTIVRG